MSPFKEFDYFTDLPSTIMRALHYGYSITFLNTTMLSLSNRISEAAGDNAAPLMLKAPTETTYFPWKISLSLSGSPKLSAFYLNSLFV